MHIGTSNTERTYSGSTRELVCLPFSKSGIYIERAIGEIDLWIGLFKVQAGWDQAVFECQGSFDQARNARSSIQVPNVRLDRTNSTIAFFMSSSMKCLS